MFCHICSNPTYGELSRGFSFGSYKEPWLRVKPDWGVAKSILRAHTQNKIKKCQVWWFVKIFSGKIGFYLEEPTCSSEELEEYKWSGSLPLRFLSLTMGSGRCSNLNPRTVPSLWKPTMVIPSGRKTVVTI